MQVSGSSSEEVHPQNHMSVFTESRNRSQFPEVHCNLRCLFNLRGSVLRLIHPSLQSATKLCLSITQSVSASLETNAL